MAEFESLGVTSFDSTSSFRQSFMDDRDNYHTLGTDLRRHQGAAGRWEPHAEAGDPLGPGLATRRRRSRTRQPASAARVWTAASAPVDETLDAVIAYEDVIGVKKSYRTQYAETLQAAPWRSCRCGLCEKHGVEMAIFRGSERNKRRGFHNLSVLAEKMKTLRPRMRHSLKGQRSG